MTTQTNQTPPAATIPHIRWKSSILFLILAIASSWNVDSIAREREWCTHVITADSLGFTDKAIQCNTYAFHE